MEGSKHLTSVGDALQDKPSVPQPGDDDFDPTAPQPGDPEYDPEYDAWVAEQADQPEAPPAPMRPSERVEQEEALQRPDVSADERPVVLGYLIQPRLAMELLGYLGQMPHDEVRPLIDGLQQATAIPAERAGTSGGSDVDQDGESG